MFKKAYSKGVKGGRIISRNINHSCFKKTFNKPKNVANLFELPKDFLCKRYEKAEVVRDNIGRRENPWETE